MDLFIVYGDFPRSPVHFLCNCNMVKVRESNSKKKTKGENLSLVSLFKTLNLLPQPNQIKSVCVFVVSSMPSMCGVRSSHLKIGGWLLICTFYPSSLSIWLMLIELK